MHNKCYSLVSINTIIVLSAIILLTLVVSLMIQLGIAFAVEKPDCLDKNNSTKKCYCDQLQLALNYLGRGEEYNK